MSIIITIMLTSSGNMPEVSLSDFIFPFAVSEQDIARRGNYSTYYQTATTLYYRYQVLVDCPKIRWKKYMYVIYCICFYRFLLVLYKKMKQKQQR